MKLRDIYLHPIDHTLKLRKIYMEVNIVELQWSSLMLKWNIIYKFLLLFKSFRKSLRSFNSRFTGWKVLLVK